MFFWGNYSAQFPETGCSAALSFPRAETVQEFRFWAKIPKKPRAVGWGERICPWTGSIRATQEQLPGEPQQSMGYVVPFVGVRTSPQPTKNSCTVSLRGNAEVARCAAD